MPRKKNNHGALEEVDETGVRPRFRDRVHELHELQGDELHALSHECSMILARHLADPDAKEAGLAAIRTEPFGTEVAPHYKAHSLISLIRIVGQTSDHSYDYLT